MDSSGVILFVNVRRSITEPYQLQIVKLTSLEDIYSEKVPLPLHSLGLFF